MNGTETHLDCRSMQMCSEKKKKNGRVGTSACIDRSLHAVLEFRCLALHQLLFRAHAFGTHPEKIKREKKLFRASKKLKKIVECSGTHAARILSLPANLMLHVCIMMSTLQTYCLRLEKTRCIFCEPYFINGERP